MEAVSLTKLTKQKNLRVITFWNPNGMSMNDTKNVKTKTAEMWEYPSFIHD